MANITEKDSQAIQGNCNDYKSWSFEDAAEWIISVDSSKFEKYRETLNNSFKSDHFNIELITDPEDLKKHGIADLDERKTIYNAITELIATQKSSQDTQIDTEDKEIKTSELSTSADEEEEDESERYHSESAKSSVCSDIEDEKKLIDEDDNQWNLELQRQNLVNNGYCKWPYNQSYEELTIILTSGYVRTYYEEDHKINQDIYQVIREFYGMILDVGDEVKLRLGADHLYLTTITNISLSKVLSASLQASDSNTITVDESKFPRETFEHALMYLGHHGDVEPDPLPCPIRSIHMRQICSDKWDADWIDAFDKKTIFEIILVAKDLDINSLLHLGCAKIATLIKQLDQKEINRIIEEEEKYRREHANDNNNDASDSEDGEDQKIEQTVPTAPSVAMLDELVAIFDHDYNDQIEYNEEDEEDEDEKEARIQGIDDEDDKIEKRIAEKSNNPTVAILDELLLAFDY